MIEGKPADNEFLDKKMSPRIANPLITMAACTIIEVPNTKCMCVKERKETGGEANLQLIFIKSRIGLSVQQNYQPQKRRRPSCR